MRGQTRPRSVRLRRRIAALGTALVADSRGSVTAEFAITVPAVLLVLGLVVGSVQIAAQRVSLTALAGDLARLEARGDSALAAARLESFSGDPRISLDGDGRVLCVTASSGPKAGLLATLSVTGHGCAAVAEGSSPARLSGTVIFQHQRADS